MLIDSHAHLTDERFKRDRESIIEAFNRDRLEAVITSGSSMKSSKEAVELAKKYRKVYATVGVHPCNTDEMTEDAINILRKMAMNKNVVAIGEIGLDYHYDNVPREVQKKWFIRQIELAKEIGKPIVVHDREANEDTFETIKENIGHNLKGVIHCYSGDLALAKKYIELGFYISIAGPVTYRSAHKLKEVAKNIPLEYIFIETDSPCLTPSAAGRRRNEPLYVSYVAAMIAELRGVSFEAVAIQTTKNVKRLYNI